MTDDDRCDPQPLVGMAFHVFGDDKKPKWQGHIIGQASADVVIVQFFEWLSGTPHTCRVVPIADIVAGGASPYASDGHWLLYRGVDAMVAHYKAKGWGRIR